MVSFHSLKYDEQAANGDDKKSGLFIPEVRYNYLPVDCFLFPRKSFSPTTEIYYRKNKWIPQYLVAFGAVCLSLGLSLLARHLIDKCKCVESDEDISTHEFAFSSIFG